MASQRTHHEVFISSEVIDEVSVPAFPRRDAALALIASIPALDVDDVVLGVAHALVHQRLMPGPAEAGDAVHVAVCCVQCVDYLLSWNVRHLANPNKSLHLQAVCRKLGLIPPRIITPDLLWNAP